MNRVTNFFTGMLTAATALGVGAGLMYFLDPNRGWRRRELAAGQINRGLQQGNQAINQTLGGMRSRTQGIMDQTRQAVMGQRPNSRIPTAMRGLMAASGGSLAFYGRRRKNLVGTALSVAGLGLVASGVAAIPIRRLLNRRHMGEGIEIDKTIEIDAPVDEVFRFLSEYENLPRFLSHVRAINMLDNGRAHWRVGDPETNLLEWDTITTSQIPNEQISWRSTADSAIRASGSIRLRRFGRDGTRLALHLAYAAPGALSAQAANILGEYPMQQLDEDLLRLRKLIESQVSRKRIIESAEMPMAA